MAFEITEYSLLEDEPPQAGVREESKDAIGVRLPCQSSRGGGAAELPKGVRPEE